MSSWEAQVQALAEQAQDQLHAVQVRSGIEVRTQETPLDFVSFLTDGGLDDEGLTTEGLTEEEAAELEAQWSERLAGARAFLEFVFRDGYDPARVMRRTYAVARKVKPRLIGHMSIADQAVIFGETRSATDSRMQKIFRGMGVRERGEKTESSKKRMAASQRGNGNRANGEKKKRVLAVGEMPVPKREAGEQKAGEAAPMAVDPLPVAGAREGGAE